MWLDSWTESEYANPYLVPLVSLFNEKSLKRHAASNHSTISRQDYWTDGTKPEIVLILSTIFIYLTQNLETIMHNRLLTEIHKNKNKNDSCPMIRVMM